MDNTIVSALIGLSALVIIDITVVAFSYGKLSQKVDDLMQRVKRLEKLLNGR